MLSFMDMHPGHVMECIVSWYIICTAKQLHGSQSTTGKSFFFTYMQESVRYSKAAGSQSTTGRSFLFSVRYSKSAGSQSTTGSVYIVIQIQVS